MVLLLVLLALAETTFRPVVSNHRVSERDGTKHQSCQAVVSGEKGVIVTSVTLSCLGPMQSLGRVSLSEEPDSVRASARKHMPVLCTYTSRHAWSRHDRLSSTIRAASDGAN